MMLLTVVLLVSSCGSAEDAAKTDTAKTTVPGAPTIGAATAGNGQATITFTAPGSNGGSEITGYTVTSSPGSITAAGAASPLIVAGLTNGTEYIFTVTATNGVGTGPASAASNSVTPGDGNQPTAAIVKLITTGTLPAGAQVGGIDVTLYLPAGVTVKSAATPPETDSGVVTASGVAASNSSLISTVTTATGAVRILLANPNGFGTGEFATVNCDIAAGSHPAQTDFSVSGMTTKDLNGSAFSGLAAGFTADIH
jgi:hypothetical protein